MNNEEKLKELEKQIEEYKKIIKDNEEAFDYFNRQRISNALDYNNLLNEYKKILNSNIWKKTEPIRKTKDKLKLLLKKPNNNLNSQSIASPYNNWIKSKEKNLEKLTFSYNPLISIVVPVYNVISSQLEECINSVLNQLYDNYELILVDDCSSLQETKDTLKKYENTNKIKVIYRDENGGISKATNTALEYVTGEFVGFFDCDDVLSLNALQEVVKALNNNKNLDFIYTDYDILSEDGSIKYDPFFKPDWSPDLMIWGNYTSHFSVYRNSLIKEVGDHNKEFDGAQDYDFVLRFVEKTEPSKIYHIAKILYHWRARKESTATDSSIKQYMLSALPNVRNTMLQRRNIKGHTEDETFRNVIVTRLVYDNNNEGVSIIIPSKDSFEVLKRCIESIINITSYKNYEIIVVDNGSNEENKKTIEKYLNSKNIKYVYFNESFNFSKMCNIGANNSSKELLLFLNDDIEVIHEDWLTRMVGQAIQSHTGAVGAKLYYPNSMIIQHCGLGNYLGGPGHFLQGNLDTNDFYFSRNRANYNVIAVTAACLMVDKNKFNEINGFDETFPLNYNDVDLCMRLDEKGYFNIIRNDVKLYHHESLTRGMSSAEKLFNDRKRLFEKNTKYKNHDPYYNKNLPQFSGNFDYLSNMKNESI